MRNVLVAFLSTAVIVAGAAGFFIYEMFFSTGRLPEGELIGESMSPDGTYLIKVYRTNGGATVSYAIRAELHFLKQNRKPKNIYWNYREDDADIVWHGDGKVEINGHVLNLPHDVYDFRRN